MKIFSREHAIHQDFDDYLSEFAKTLVKHHNMKADNVRIYIDDYRHAIKFAWNKNMCIEDAIIFVKNEIENK
jgi:hypothetical protein